MYQDTQADVAAEPFDLPRLCTYFSDRSPQPVVAVGGPDHVVRYLNPAFARLAGKRSKEIIGHPFVEAVPEAAGNGHLALLDRVFQTGMPAYLEEQEHGQTPADFWSYAMWAILGPEQLPAGVMIQVTEVTEIAAFRRNARAMNEALIVSSVRQHELIETIRQGEQERRVLEAQMFQAQKMESLGVLAGGIAHDLNNMLTPVLGFAILASESLPIDSPAAPMLEEVEKSTRRAADLVQQILMYAGKGRFVVQAVDLSSLVREMSGLLGSAVSINADLRYDLDSAIPSVEADATQLRQVVMNLVINASEAVEANGGSITIRTGLAQPGQQGMRSVLAHADLPKGPAVFLEVADTGQGMDAEVMEKIFDPFFTTKFTGRGLGLAVVQGVARGHHAALQVRSEPGRGSTFRLLLPASTAPVAAPIVPPPAVGWRGTGTVLVIDDEKGVRDVVARVLTEAGLSVLISGDGQEGLSMYREHHQRIDAVVLDLTMPRMGGREVTKALRGLRPDLPIVLMSGFTVQELSLQSAGLEITGFVQKPFDVGDLLSAVRHALEQ